MEGRGVTSIIASSSAAGSCAASNLAGIGWKHWQALKIGPEPMTSSSTRGLPQASVFLPPANSRMGTTFIDSLPCCDSKDVPTVFLVEPDLLLSRRRC